jgi:hypothetical protein
MREAWGAYPPNGAANMTAWMIGNGHALLTTINQACAAQGFAPGSGTMCAEIQARTMLNYTEVTTVTSHAMFSQWVGFLEVEDLLQAEVLVTSGSEWAKLMSRAVTFAGTSCAMLEQTTKREAEPRDARLWIWCPDILRHSYVETENTAPYAEGPSGGSSAHAAAISES